MEETKPQETVAQEALRLLKDIPEEEFLIDTFSDEKSRCCVIGHYTRLKSTNPEDYTYRNCADFMVNSEHRIFRNRSRDFMQSVHGDYQDISVVNNTRSVNGYTEETVKARVMHCLEDMVKAGY